MPGTLLDDLKAQVAKTTSEKLTTAYNFIGAELSRRGAQAATDDDEAPAPAPQAAGAIRRGPKVVAPPEEPEEEAPAEEGPPGDESPEVVDDDEGAVGEPETIEEDEAPPPPPAPKAKAKQAPKAALHVFKVGEVVNGPLTVTKKKDEVRFEAQIAKLYKAPDGRMVASLNYTDPEFPKNMPKDTPRTKNAYVTQLEAIEQEAATDNGDDE